MLGSDLIHLSKVSALARLEFAQPRLTLRTENSRLIAQCVGAYSAGQRSVERTKDVPDLDLDVDSGKFKALIGSFSANEDVKLGRTQKTLTFKSARHRFQIESFPVGERRSMPETGAKIAIVDIRKFITNVDIAAEVNAKGVGTKAPMGIQLASLTKNRLRILSFNGQSALYMAQLTCDETVPNITITAPASDLALGLDMFIDGPVQLSATDKRFCVFNDRAWFDCAMNTTKWPDFSELLKTTIKRTSITFTGSQVKAVADAAKVLDSAAHVELAQTDDGVVLRTLVTEKSTGEYSTLVEGTISRSYWFGTEDLLLASKLGETIYLELPEETNAPTFVRGENHMLILTHKVSV